MSLETWKAEFYFVNAEDVPEEEALDHSIRKWEGLRKENLDRHCVDHTGHYLEHGSYAFRLSSETCALCAHYLDEQDDNPCTKCPLARVRNGLGCDIDILAVDAPYQQYIFSEDPEPMIFWLKKAKEMVNG